MRYQYWGILTAERASYITRCRFLATSRAYVCAARTARLAGMPHAMRLGLDTAARYRTLGMLH